MNLSPTVFTLGFRYFNQTSEPSIFGQQNARLFEGLPDSGHPVNVGIDMSICGIRLWHLSIVKAANIATREDVSGSKG